MSHFNISFQKQLIAYMQVCANRIFYNSTSFQVKTVILLANAVKDKQGDFHHNKVDLAR